jgi:hypothetical protein
VNEQDRTEIFEIPKHQIDMQHGKVIRVRKGSRFVSATVASDAVIMQIFEGDVAKQQWEDTWQYNRNHLNPHVLDVLGVSPASVSPPYIILKGGMFSLERGLPSNTYS